MYPLREVIWIVDFERINMATPTGDKSFPWIRYCCGQNQSVASLFRMGLGGEDYGVYEGMQ